MCDNLKKARECEQGKLNKASNIHVSEEKTVSFGDESEFVFHQGSFCDEVISDRVTKFYKVNTNKPLSGYLLLDSGSTVDLIQDKWLLKDIKVASNACRISTNGGTVITNKTGILLGYGEVWYHPEALANLLSLHNMKQKLKIIYDNEQEDCFTVHKSDGVKKFVAKTNGLYALQVCDLCQQTNRSYTGM